MIAATAYEGKTVAVFGLARSGLTAARSLVEGGARVLAWDDREAACEIARNEGLPVHDLRDADWSRIDALVLSPGVPHALPEAHWTAEMANAAGVPIICDVEVFVRQIAGSDARVVAITGTNGKSTTTALTAHILRSAGLSAHEGGNIGRGVLDLPKPAADTVYVLELSSYQLERTPSLHADVGVFLNLSPDHLERHGDMKGYEAAKRNVFANQDAGDTAVVGVDDGVGRCIVTAMVAAGVQTVVPVSTRSVVADGITVKGGTLLDATAERSEAPLDIGDVETLRGRHNHQNAGAAYAAARALGVRPADIARGLKSFPGLAHRMELVGRAGPVAFVNDSKATNADSAEQALRAYDSVHWIVGGLPKAGGIEGLVPLFDRVEKAYVIGAAGTEFTRTLTIAGVANTECGELDKAVRAAARDAFAAGRETAVLLSPACASFDQFKDFEARGEAFREAAKQIVAMYAAEANGAA